MMGQSEWRFKVESTSAKSTPRAGVVLVDRMAEALEVRGKDHVLVVAGHAHLEAEAPDVAQHEVGVAHGQSLPRAPALGQEAISYP